jgi:hypothetical protein
MTFRNRKIRSRKIRSRKIRNRKIKSRNRKSRNRKSHNKFKKYGGTQTHFIVNFSGIINKKSTFNIDTQIGDLVRAFKNSFIDGKTVNVALHHRGILLSTYPLDSRVYDVLSSDDEGNAIYNITTTESSQ